jgi:hypothetical protein
MTEFRWISHALVILTLLAVPAERAASYDVEADSATNTVFVLLWNHASASYDSISIDEALPAFVSLATASIIPASVPANGSDLAAIEFNVAPGAALGSTGDLTITVLGSVSGQPINVVLTVPLEVVASAPVAQGVVGVGVPMPDPGGSDSDGDGISDALEIAFGSDPNDPLSTPGSAPAVPAVPSLQALGLACLAALFVLCATWLGGRRQPDGSRR